MRAKSLRQIRSQKAPQAQSLLYSAVDLASADRRSRSPKNAVEGLERFAPDRLEDGRFDPRYSLDPGVRHYVLVLRSNGIETWQACQGGPGHAYLEPTVEFSGQQEAGPLAVADAIGHGLPIAELRREWSIRNGGIHGPIWTITFNLRANMWLKREAERSKAYFKRHKTGRDAC
jgi:hypothetical protein